MTDHFSAILTAYKAQIQTLNDIYFPEAQGLAAGWQVSEDDTTPMQGGDYFVILRPGAFSTTRRGQFQDNEWHVTTILYYRFSEYATLWQTYRAFRSDILGLPDTAPLKTMAITEQVFSAQENAGYLLDSNGNYTNFVVQTLDCRINQSRVITSRAF